MLQSVGGVMVRPIALLVFLAACSGTAASSPPGSGGDVPGLETPESDAVSREPTPPDETKLDEPAPAPSSLASGSIDPSYGARGTLEIMRPSRPITAFSRSGRFVWASSGENRNLPFYAFDAAGKPDELASKRITITDADNHSKALSVALSLADDGSVLVFGSMRRSGAPWPFVARVKNGELDPKFGTRGILAIDTYHARVAALQEIRDAKQAVTGYYVGVSADAVGKKAPGGERDAEYRLYKMSTKGELEATFGSEGSVKLSGELYAVDAGGRAVVARPYNPASPSANYDCTQFITQRYTTDGALDTGYGTATATIPASRVSDALLLQNGEMLLSLTIGESARFARISSTGVTIDAAPRRALIEVAAPYTGLAAELPDGKILVSSYIQNDRGLVERRNADLSLDAKFAKSGTFLAPQAKEFIERLAPTSSGAIMMATTVLDASGAPEALRVRRLAR